MKMDATYLSHPTCDRATAEQGEADGRLEDSTRAAIEELVSADSLFVESTIGLTLLSWCAAVVRLG